jgi:isopentenyl-diphosphate Delta-isomerase
MAVYAEAPRPDPTEIGAWRWMAAPAIKRALRSDMRPDSFTPWFQAARLSVC